MRLAYCIPALYSPGGMERVLTLKANYLAALPGYEVHIIITDGKGREPYFPLDPSVNVHQLDINFEEMYRYPLWKRYWLYRKKQYRFKELLDKCLKAIKPDITISMLRREINFVNCLTDGSIKVGEIHFSRTSYRGAPSSHLPSWINNWLGRCWMNQLIRELRKLSAFVVLTEEDKAAWTELDNVRVILNPLSFIPSTKSVCESRQVIAAGRYVMQKGFDLLIEAWSKVVRVHPDWTLRIYGDGWLRPQFQQMVEKYGLSSHCILEHPVTDIEQKMLESSIFVFSSRYEGFGLALTEAMACGLPVVSYACPCGPKDIISHGEDGFLVEEQNVGELANRINFLIEHEDMRKLMGRKAAESSMRYSIDRIGLLWQELFETLKREKECIK